MDHIKETIKKIVSWNVAHYYIYMCVCVHVYNIYYNNTKALVPKFWVDNKLSTD